MARFTNSLHTILIEDDPKQWRLLAPLVYHSDVADTIFVVPEGFITDFASVPRLPLAYFFAGNEAHRASVIHDFLYETKLVDKKIADKVFLEAMEVTGVPAWRRYPMYWAVAMFGGNVWEYGL